MAHHFKLIYLCVARHWISNRTGGTLKKKEKLFFYISAISILCMIISVNIDSSLETEGMN